MLKVGSIGLVNELRVGMSVASLEASDPYADTSVWNHPKYHVIDDGVSENLGPKRIAV